MADVDTAGELTGAQSLVKSLEQVGAETVFGIPGGAILPAYDPLYDSEHVRHILVRHEQGAGHAAQGYAMVTGKVGVCMATSGRGRPTWSPRSPTRTWTRCRWWPSPVRSPPAIGTDAFQEADIRGITMPITKHNFLVTKAEEIPAAIAAAFHIAGTGRPGSGAGRHHQGRLAGQVRFHLAEAAGPAGLPTGDQAARQAGARGGPADRRPKRPVLYVGGGVLKAQRVRRSCASSPT